MKEEGVIVTLLAQWQCAQLLTEGLDCVSRVETHWTFQSSTNYRFVTQFNFSSVLSESQDAWRGKIPDSPNGYI